MKFTKYFKTFALALLVLSAVVNSFAQAQTLPSPRENKLLNGTRLLVWNDPKADKVTVKLRVHSGSAFDPLGKEGVMQLLTDILFPVEATKEFFTEDLNGSFDIFNTYDFIQINASGDSDKLLNILETLAPTVTNLQINKESTERVRAALLARLKELEKDSNYVAGQAVAKGLFGNYPYGRSKLGTTESLSKIDFADLLFAKQKFLTADNATITISGKVNPDFALRATKRLFGGWLKADKKIPATFALPETPKAETVRIEKPEFDKTASYFGIRWLARNDKDLPAAQLLNMTMAYKIIKQEPTPDKGFQPAAFLLNGVLIYNDGGTDTKPENIQAKFAEPITTADFEKGKELLMASIQNRLATLDGLSDWWLDAETYKLPTVAEQLKIYNSLTLADVQRVAARLQKEPVIAVYATKSTETTKN